MFGLEGVGFDSWGADVAYLYDDHAWMVAQGYGFDFYPVRCIARAEYEPVTYIQDVTASTCPSEPTTVVDRRDGEEYTIQQLADGNCWMLDNLRLDPTNINVRHETTFHTTNASTNTLSYLEWGGGDTSDQYAIDGIANWTSGYSYSAPLINTTYKDTTGTGGYAAGKYGVYYNYCAASAGSYCYGDGTDPGTPSGIISEDICPKGWRLPNSGESQEIYRSYTSDYTRFVSAFHSSLPGYFDGAIQNQGSVGLYWTSSNYGSSNSNMYRLHVDASYVSTEDFGGRYNGYSIRCILK